MKKQTIKLYSDLLADDLIQSDLQMKPFNIVYTFLVN